MHIGLVGLGKMGGNMRDPPARRRPSRSSGTTATRPCRDVESLPALVERARRAARRVGHGALRRRRPATTVAKLADAARPGRPGHRRRQLALHRRRARTPQLLAAEGIGYLDCGVSGGIWGLENGYGLMVGGRRGRRRTAMPVFDALRPEGPREEGFVHAGPVGAGHYAKMVHNGIEYGLMQAYAEGYELLAAKDIVTDVPGVLQGLVARHRRALLAARPAGPGARGRPRARRRLRLRRGLRRGPLDGRGGHRRTPCRCR